MNTHAKLQDAAKEFLRIRKGTHCGYRIHGLIVVVVCCCCCGGGGGGCGGGGGFSCCQRACGCVSSFFFFFFLPKPFLLWLVCRHQLGSSLIFFCCDSYVCSFCGVVDVAVVVAMVVAVVIAVVADVLVVVVVPVAS